MELAHWAAAINLEPWQLMARFFLKKPGSDDASSYKKNHSNEKNLIAALDPTGGILVVKNMKDSLAASRVQTLALKIPSATTAARSKVHVIEIYCHTRHSIRTGQLFFALKAFQLKVTAGDRTNKQTNSFRLSKIEMERGCFLRSPRQDHAFGLSPHRTIKLFSEPNF